MSAVTHDYSKHRMSQSIINTSSTTVSGTTQQALQQHTAQQAACCCSNAPTPTEAEYVYQIVVADAVTVAWGGQLSQHSVLQLYLTGSVCNHSV